MKKRILPLMFAVLLISLMFSACSGKNGFVKDSEGKVRFYRDGETLIGWYELNGDRYYFDEDGVMAVGWLPMTNHTFYFNGSGVMISGELEIDGVPCRFDEEGRAVDGLYTAENKDVYYYEQGRQKTGWINDGGAWKYFGEDGKMAVGLQEIEGGIYLFDNNGQRQSGIFSVGGKTMYFDADGKRQTGFQVIDGERYYFDDDGTRLGFSDIQGATYYFDQTGAAVTGWREIESKRYYFSEDGTMARDITIEETYVGVDGVAQAGGGHVSNPNPGGSEDEEGALNQVIGDILESIIDDSMDDTQRLEAAYRWVVDRMRYRFITVDLSQGYTRSLINELAKYSADYRSGSCEHYAAIFYALIEQMGFSAIVVEGERLDSTNGLWGAHAWVIAEVGGKNYQFDPLFGRNHTNNAMSMFMTTDSVLEPTHRWNTDYYPPCAG